MGRWQRRRIAAGGVLREDVRDHALAYTALVGEFYLVPFPQRHHGSKIRRQRVPRVRPFQFHAALLCRGLERWCYISRIWLLTASAIYG
jgi:hypothetical protein